MKQKIVQIVQKMFSKQNHYKKYECEKIHFWNIFFEKKKKYYKIEVDTCLYMYMSMRSFLYERWDKSKHIPFAMKYNSF